MTGPEYVVLAFIAFALLVCALAFIGALPWGWLADRAPSDPLDEKRELFDPAAAIAADVLDRAARDEAYWRSIQDAVAAAHFDITLDQIRRLPEVSA